MKKLHDWCADCLIANCNRNFAVEILEYLAHISILKSKHRNNFNPDVRMISNENRLAFAHRFVHIFNRLVSCGSFRISLEIDAIIAIFVLMCRINQPASLFGLAFTGNTDTGLYAVQFVHRFCFITLTLSFFCCCCFCCGWC